MQDRPYTVAQQAVVDSAEGKMIHFGRYLLVQAKQARDAIVDLPHTNEAGQPVTHACNRECELAGEAFYQAALEVTMRLDGETRLRLFREFDFRTNRSFHARFPV